MRCSWCMVNGHHGECVTASHRGTRLEACSLRSRAGMSVYNGGLEIPAPLSAREMSHHAESVRHLQASSGIAPYLAAARSTRAAEIDARITREGDLTLKEVIAAVRFGGEFYQTAREDSLVIAAMVRQRLKCDLDTLPGLRESKEYGAQLHLATQLDDIAAGGNAHGLLILLTACKVSAASIIASGVRARARAAAASPMRQRWGTMVQTLKEIDALAGQDDYFDLSDERRCAESYDRWVDLPSDMQIEAIKKADQALGEMKLRLRGE